MKKGDTVKYSKPQNEDERKARFILLEDPVLDASLPAWERRVQIQYVCNMFIKPINTVDALEIEPA